MESLNLALLGLAVLGSLASVALQFVLWLMHNGLVARMAKLEAQQAATLTTLESRQIYERLSHVEALLAAQASAIKSIQEHLLGESK